MRPLEIGLAIETSDVGPDGAVGWPEMSEIVAVAEEAGFDTLWVADELFGRTASGGTVGFWDVTGILSAVAAVTKEVRLGSWVYSAVHRNVGVTVKAAETVDAISGGRFIFGFGAGHGGTTAHAFGFEADRVVSRYEEALEIVVALIREGTADFTGEYHVARDLENTPRGPQAGSMPLMLAGNGPRTVGLAVDHGDIWSGYSLENQTPESFAPLLELVARTCDERGRDPASLGKSVSVAVNMTDDFNWEDAGFGQPLAGTPSQLADQVFEFAAMGATSLEIMAGPLTPATVEILGQMLQILDS